MLLIATVALLDCQIALQIEIATLIHFEDFMCYMCDALS